jgi:hypothetical protein
MESNIEFTSYILNDDSTITIYFDDILTSQALLIIKENNEDELKIKVNDFYSRLDKVDISNITIKMKLFYYWLYRDDKKKIKMVNGENLELMSLNVPLDLYHQIINEKF